MKIELRIKEGDVVRKVTDIDWPVIKKGRESYLIRTPAGGVWIPSYLNHKSALWIEMLFGESGKILFKRGRLLNHLIEEAPASGDGLVQVMQKGSINKTGKSAKYEFTVFYKAIDAGDLGGDEKIFKMVRTFTLPISQLITFDGKNYFKKWQLDKRIKEYGSRPANQWTVASRNAFFKKLEEVVLAEYEKNNNSEISQRELEPGRSSAPESRP